MEIEVEEGRFVEGPTADATGMERRAFGEFVSHRGEMASYAFGWITGSEPRVARMSVGIGVGNPGGATFHADLHEHEGDLAYGLVDEPFEDVPQGGPHLTAEEARAHDTLRFIWWVADTVLERDRRAWWMRHWVLGTTSIQTVEVFERREPILFVSHDDDDGIWQLIGTTGGRDTEGRLGHLHHAIDEDPTLIDVLALAPGQRATRERVGGPWTRHEA